MDAYVDQNFLINCINRNGWRGGVRLIVSPWTIFEIGKATPSHMEELLSIVEEFKPSWILERADLQLREFVVAWNDFWNGKRSRFSPIGTLAEAQASFLRCPLEHVETYSPREYADIWKRPEASREAGVEFRRQASISAFNRIAFAGGMLTPKSIREIRVRYVARQFVVARGVGQPHHLIQQEENLILNDSRLRTFIGFFVEFGGMDGMLAHRVEESLTFHQWKSSAKLNPRRQLDRFHATSALPYCDLFVTSDAELIKKSQAIRDEVEFKVATVLSGENFIACLEKYS